MNNLIKFDKFLKYYVKIYKQNPGLPISKDTIFHGLMTYGLKEEEKQDKSIKYMFKKWIEHYKNTNLIVCESELQNRFLQFHSSNGRNFKDYVKIYITFSKEDMEASVMHIFDFINLNNYETYSKVLDVIRLNDIVLRMTNINDTKKVIVTICNNFYLFSNKFLTFSVFLKFNLAILLSSSTPYFFAIIAACLSTSGPAPFFINI